MEGFPTVITSISSFSYPLLCSPQRVWHWGTGIWEPPVHWELWAGSTSHARLWNTSAWAVCYSESAEGNSDRAQPQSSQEPLLTCCPCLCHTGLHLSWVTDRSLGYPHSCWQFAIPHLSASSDESFSHADKSCPFLILPGASCCHISLARSVPASSIWLRFWL